MALGMELLLVASLLGLCREGWGVWDWWAGGGMYAGSTELKQNFEVFCNFTLEGRIPTCVGIVEREQRILGQ